MKHNGVMSIKRPVFGEVYTDYNLGATNLFMISSIIRPVNLLFDQLDCRSSWQI
jgi:hypothetical protein